MTKLTEWLIAEPMIAFVCSGGKEAAVDPFKCDHVLTVCI